MYSSAALEITNSTCLMDSTLSSLVAMRLDGGAGTETLGLFDTSDANGETCALSNTPLLKDPTIIDYVNFESLHLATGAGGDTVNVTKVATLLGI